MKNGVSYIFKKYSKYLKVSSSKYLKSCDSKRKTKLITYFEANNLYCYAFSKFLPTSSFKWIDPNDFELNKDKSNSSKGCVLEVDLECPKELNNWHNRYLWPHIK